MLLQNAFKLFMIDRQSYCAEKSVIFYQDNVPKFIDFVGYSTNTHPDEVLCSRLSRDLVLNYITFLRDGTRKNTTINTYFRAVKTFLNFCIEEGFCSPDVLRKVKMLKSDAAPVIPLTNDEVDEIDDLYGWKCESDLRNLCMIHLMLDAGFRSSDVVNLMYSNINFDNNYLYIKGKGDKFRTVILCPKLKKMLSHYLLKYRACAPGDDFPVFAKVGTSERINPNVIRQLFTRIKKGSGIERVHPHLLRHTFATSYILGGGNMEYLRMMLGHSDYETTKLYLHLAQEAKMLNYDIYKLDSVFFKSVY